MHVYVCTTGGSRYAEIEGAHGATYIMDIIYALVPNGLMHIINIAPRPPASYASVYSVSTIIL